MIVVTGAAGFIGSNLAHRLTADGGGPLLLVDRKLTPAKAANFVGLDDFIFLGHEKFITELEAGRIDAREIFHLGACSDTTVQDWDFLSQNNLEYTRRLWRWCADHGRSFIYASSAATYGDGSQGFDDELPPGGLVPLNLYGRSKNDFDKWVLAEVKAGNPTPVGWAGLKFFNVYGPGESHKKRMASVVFHAFNQISETGGMRLFASNRPGMGDGEQQRDFVFVGDCVEHMLWFRAHPEVNGVFNSGTGQARSFNDLVKAVFRAMGKPERLDYFPMPEDLRGRYQDYTQATMTKLTQAGYAGEATSLENGVEQYVRWLISNQS